MGASSKLIGTHNFGRVKKCLWLFGIQKTSNRIFQCFFSHCWLLTDICVSASINSDLSWSHCSGNIYWNWNLPIRILNVWFISRERRKFSNNPPPWQIFNFQSDLLAGQDVNKIGIWHFPLGDWLYCSVELVQKWIETLDLKIHLENSQNVQLSSRFATHCCLLLKNTFNPCIAKYCSSLPFTVFVQIYFN